MILILKVRITAYRYIASCAIMEVGLFLIPLVHLRQLFFKIKAMRYFYLFLITLLFNIAVKISKSKYLLF